METFILFAMLLTLIILVVQLRRNVQDLQRDWNLRDIELRKKLTDLGRDLITSQQPEMTDLPIVEQKPAPTIGTPYRSSHSHTRQPQQSRLRFP